MTAEIAIMNREAVALAADSAVTISGRRSNKIYNTANKLFSLSKFEPVGVMVYGNATFCDIPWETIVKSYRDQLHDKSFDTLPEFAADLRRFIENSQVLFPPSERNRLLEYDFYVLLVSICDSLDLAVKGQLEAGQDLTEAAIVDIVRTQLDTMEARLTKEAKDPLVEEQGLDSAIEIVRPQVAQIIEDVFAKRPLPADVADRLLSLFRLRLGLTNPPRTDLSGVVVAGFGRNDVFPRLRDFSPFLFMGEKLKFRDGSPIDIDHRDNPVIVRAFAQSDMVSLFMEGVDRDYARAVDDYIGTLLSGLPEVLLDSLKLAEGINRSEVQSRLHAAMTSELSRFQEVMDEFRHERFVDPIIQMVSVLPKDEVASMAEALVSLVSLKRRVSPDAETVGGPIDVAVISKGDGFIWIKRKHYFDPKLNGNFFAKYSRDRRNVDER